MLLLGEDAVGHLSGAKNCDQEKRGKETMVAGTRAIDVRRDRVECSHTTLLIASSEADVTNIFSFRRIGVNYTSRDARVFVNVERKSSSRQSIQQSSVERKYVTHYKQRRQLDQIGVDNEDHTPHR